MNPPTITAMMLVRDRATLVEEAAASVLAQSERALELVILDDASRDDTWKACERIAARDERVRLLRNEQSHGIPAARNQVLASARGRYVAICDSDDLSRPERFALQRALLDGDPGLVGVGALINAFSDEPADGHTPGWHWGLRDGRLPFAFPSAMLRVDEVRAVGGFDERFMVAEDLELSYRLAAAGGRFATIDQVLVDYRVHVGAITAGRATLRDRWTLRAQLAGWRALRGRFSPRGHAVLVQSSLRLLLSRAGLRR